MWDIIRRIKGLPEDPYTQQMKDIMCQLIDAQIEEENKRKSAEEQEAEREQERQWENALRNDWQDLINDLAHEKWDEGPEEQPCPMAPEELEMTRNEILNLFQKLGLSLKDRFRLCRTLCELAQEAPSDELLRVYCYLLCDDERILDKSCRNPKNQMCWRTTIDYAETLYRYLQERREKSERFQSILEQMKNVRVPDSNCATVDPYLQEEIFQVCTELFSDSHGMQLGDNIIYLLQTVSRNKVLAVMKPLFFYRMMTRHAKRLQNTEASSIDIDYVKLWEYQNYKIGEDNRKNFDQYESYTRFFWSLCKIFQNDPQVDPLLCVYGFDHLSNLGKFNRFSPSESQILPFDIAIEDIVSETLFSCWKGKDKNNPILKNAYLSSRRFEQFQCSREKKRMDAFKQISDSINSHLEELITRFWDSSCADRQNLCKEILKASKLDTPQNPKHTEETFLFLAAIYDALVTAVDDDAIDYLVQAGNLLIGEIVYNIY